MPNVRKKDKKLVSAWVPEKLHADIRRIAKMQDRSASEVIDELLTSFANNHPLIQVEKANSNTSADARAKVVQTVKNHSKKVSE